MLRLVQSFALFHIGYSELHEDPDYSRSRKSSCYRQSYSYAHSRHLCREQSCLTEYESVPLSAAVYCCLGEKAGTIELHNLGPRWDDLYDLVAASDEPWRDEVLQIIKARVKADPRWLDPREMRLRKLHDGLVWPELEEKYLAPLRSGISGAVVVSWHPERDTLVIRDTVVIEKREVIVHENYCRPETVAPAPRVREKADQTKAWAVKTNLLLLGVVAPNLEVELPLGEQNRWSVEVEAFAPWFIWNNNSQASQALNLGAEIRYWLGNREYHRWLDGWHIGLALAGGYYDWEWKKSEGF